MCCTTFIICISLYLFYTEKRIAEDPELKGGPNYYFLSNSEKYANGVRKATLLAKKLKEYKLGDFTDAFLLRRYWIRKKLSVMRKENRNDL